MPTQTDAACDCGNDTFYFTKDQNLDKAWKVGNKYARICTDCGHRYFLAKSMWQDVSDQYVILDGEDEPIPIFDCPACAETVTGQPDECPYCDVEYRWEAEEDDEVDEEAEEYKEIEEDLPEDDDLEEEADAEEADAEEDSEEAEESEEEAEPEESPAEDDESAEEVEA